MSLPFKLNDWHLRTAGAFNATTSVVSFGAVGGAQLCTAQTILAYCRPDGSGEGGFSSLLYRTASGTANGLRLHIDHNAGSPRVFWGGSSTGIAANPNRNSANTITYGQWHHIAATWAGGIASSGMIVYTAANGSPLAVASPVSSAEGTGSGANNSADPLTIGNRTGSDRTFNGLIGYVARWNRVLSISELMLAQQRGPLAVPHGLIMCWTEAGDIGPYGLQATVTAVAPAVARPVRIQRPRLVLITSSGAITGTSATTNADDTSSASGTTTVTGASATTNAADTSSASGTTTVLGTSATTNADDASDASGEVGSGATGTSATTNANDTASAAGTTTVVGTSATTNANDAADASGIAGAVTGTAECTNADDQCSAQGIGGLRRETGAGRPRPQRRRHVVEIDGADVVVESAEEAVALLDQAHEQAQQRAEIAVERAAKARTRPVRKVLADARKALVVPEISAPGLEDYAAQIIKQIEDLYESSLRTIEVAALLARRERDEQDDEDVLLLIA